MRDESGRICARILATIALLAIAAIAYALIFGQCTTP